jgi:lysophospholipase L1-like esterase
MGYGRVLPVRRHLTFTRTLLALTGMAAASVVAPPGIAQASKAAPTYYVSLGDSYSVGYQPGLGATPGYTAYVARKTHLTLVNFGCSGATTTSILDTVGCPEALPNTADAASYPTMTQAAAAEAFIAAHSGHIGLITVSIGGNDVLACAKQADPLTCFAEAVVNLTTNVDALASGLRSVAGPKVPIIGLTYPDVVLGSYVYPSVPATPLRMELAQTSVVAFKSLVNPALRAAYALSGGILVDVTKETGAYIPLTKTTTLQPYGTVPVAVAGVCTLSWFCKLGNIHATTKGYLLIGKLIVPRYAPLRRG